MALVCVRNQPVLDSRAMNYCDNMAPLGCSLETVIGCTESKYGAAEKEAGGRLLLSEDQIASNYAISTVINKLPPVGVNLLEWGNAHSEVKYVFR